MRSCYAVVGEHSCGQFVLCLRNLCRKWCPFGAGSPSPRLDQKGTPPRLSPPPPPHPPLNAKQIIQQLEFRYIPARPRSVCAKRGAFSWLRGKEAVVDWGRTRMISLRRIGSWSSWDGSDRVALCSVSALVVSWRYMVKINTLLRFVIFFRSVCGFVFGVKRGGEVLSFQALQALRACVLIRPAFGNDFPHVSVRLAGWLTGGGIPTDKTRTHTYTIETDRQESCALEGGTTVSTSRR